MAPKSKNSKQTKVAKSEENVVIQQAVVEPVVVQEAVVEPVVESTPVLQSGGAKKSKASTNKKPKASTQTPVEVKAQVEPVLVDNGETKETVSAKKAVKKVVVKKEVVKKEVVKKEAKKEVEETENDKVEEDDDIKNTRSFKVQLPGDESFSGRFTGLTPYQAANKALSKYFRSLENNVEGNAQVNFSIKESTRGSKRHTYTYKGNRLKLEKPITYTIKSLSGEERIITKQYKNQLIKIKKNIPKVEVATI